MIISLAFCLAIQVGGQAPDSTTLHYTFRYTTIAVQELATLGVATHDTNTFSFILSVTTRDTIGGHIVRIATDSSRGTFTGRRAEMMQTSGLPTDRYLPQTSKTEALVIDGILQGRLLNGSLAKDPAQPGMLALFFPGLRNTSVRGDTWADSSTYQSSVGTIDMQESWVMGWRVTDKLPTGTALEGTITGMIGSSFDAGGVSTIGRSVRAGTSRATLDVQGVVREAEMVFVESGAVAATLHYTDNSTSPGSDAVTSIKHSYTLIRLP